MTCAPASSPRSAGEPRWAPRDALFLPLGTGIAAALMVDGHVLSGGGWAGELGHVSVDPAGPRCPCGGTGCLEVIASAAAIAREYASRTGEFVDARTVAERVAAATR